MSDTHGPSHPTLLRTRQGADAGRVGMVELFFDLVFVFAVTQLSHLLVAHPGAGAAAQATLLMVGVWWAWIYTSWVTNWLDPERLPVRLCLFVLMLAGLVMSASIPGAFEDRGLSFALAYVFILVGRTAFFLWAVRHERAAMRRNFQRIAVWLSLSGVFWVAGGLAAPEQRLAWWGVALLLDFAGPALYFRVPGLGRSSLADWDVDGGHLAERCALFVIIALGESLLVTGATFSKGGVSAATVSGFVSAFLGTVAMWWLYFHRGAEQGHHRIAHAAEPGRHARVAYTYLHIPIVAGIIVSAVADDMVLAEGHHEGLAPLLITLAGPALYLVGVGAFKWASNTRRLPPLSHLAGLLLLALLAPFALQGQLGLLALHIATTLVLVVVSAWEELSLGRVTPA